MYINHVGMDEVLIDTVFVSERRDKIRSKKCRIKDGVLSFCTQGSSKDTTPAPLWISNLVYMKEMIVVTVARH